MTENVLSDRVRAMFLLCAVGDALGMPCETYHAEKIKERYGIVKKYHEPVDHKWFNGHPAGTWTDDTQLTLVVAQSLVRCGALVMDDMADAHVRAMNESVFGWGGSTISSVKRYHEGVHWSESGATSDDKRGKGNGIAMKIAPLSVYMELCNMTWEKRFDLCRVFAAFTHGTHMGIMSGIAQSAAISYCLSQDHFDKRDFLEYIFVICKCAEIFLVDHVEKDLFSQRLCNMIHCDFERLDDMSKRQLVGHGTCYVYDSLPVALMCMAQHPHSMDAIYNAASYGNDTDTIAAITGTLVGLVNGTKIIPQDLLDGLQNREIVDVTSMNFIGKFVFP